MLSYQHGYHAGNFADVLKHTTLCFLLSYLNQKDKPYFYFETHAGAGMYDLRDSQANKTKEYEKGIMLLWAQQNKLKDVFNPYLNTLKNLNPDGVLRHYPGSPAIAIHLLRNMDRAYLCELHPKEYALLSQVHRHGKKIHYSHSDGLETLKAVLPPQEKRGLIFIDPSYECKEDYQLIPKKLGQEVVRFPTGIYCLWYPLVHQQDHRQLMRGLAHLGIKNSLTVELLLDPQWQIKGMNGCGLWVMNAPYTLANQLQEVGNELKQVFRPESKDDLLSIKSF